MQPFRTYAPTLELSPYVKSYLVLDVDFGAGLPMNAVPRGVPIFGFSYKPDQSIGWTRHDGTPSLQTSAMMGQTTQTVACLMHGVHQTIYVVFHSTGLHPFLREEMHALTDREYALSDLAWIDNTPSLTEQLILATNTQERIALIENLLIRRLRQVNRFPDRMRDAVRLIESSNGTRKIEEVAAYFRISRRSLERHFLTDVGIGPKHYANILRFRYVMSYLHANPSATWLDLTQLGNFVDQSHLIRHFRQFTNLTPATFLELDHQLDKQFLANTAPVAFIQ
ncbi:MAG: AraC family transcriptional regulator [Cytophagales bacterium]|nr:MAG: AraC family transcriptional regulator [Cytophagales bacterium]